MHDYRNDFTAQLDKYIVKSMKDVNERWGVDFNHTYLWLHEDDVQKMKDGAWKKDTVGFRVPGATRGHITIDENINIVEVVFYKEVCFKSMSPHGIYCFEEEVQNQIEVPQRFDLNGRWED